MITFGALLWCLVGITGTLVEARTLHRIACPPGLEGPEGTCMWNLLPGDLPVDPAVNMCPPGMEAGPAGTCMPVVPIEPAGNVCPPGMEGPAGTCINVMPVEPEGSICLPGMEGPAGTCIGKRIDADLFKKFAKLYKTLLRKKSIN